jgi:hypothetical protein
MGQVLPNFQGFRFGLKSNESKNNKASFIYFEKVLKQL